MTPKLKQDTDTGYKCWEQIHIFKKFIISLIAVSVKSCWVGIDKDIFMSIFFAAGYGFAAAL